MTRITTEKTHSGTMTSYIIKRNGCIPFKVIIFDGTKVDESAGKVTDKILHLSVFAFDNDSLTWRGLLEGPDFSHEEVEEHFRDGTIVEFALGIVKDYLGIDVGQEPTA